MFKKLILTFLILSILPFALYAQSSGKIVGKITDNNTGEPLPGVNVTLENTLMGAITDFEGYYIILNVPVGTYDVRASFVGFQDVLSTGVRVSSNITAEVNFGLKETALELDEVIVVTGERPLVEKHVTSSISTVTSEEIDALPVRGLNSLLAYQPSVVVQDGNVHIRGGRSEEVGYYLDGASTNNPLNNTNAVHIIQEAIEEVQVFAGGYTAEYGGANSGIVKADLRTGTPDYHFSVDFQTDKFVNAGEQFLGTYSYNDHVFTATASGPILGKNIRFFAAVENQYEGDWRKRWSTGFEFNDLIDTNPLNAVKDTIASLKYPDGFTPKNSRNRWALNSTLLFDYNPYRLRISAVYNNDRLYTDDQPMLHVLNPRQQYIDNNHLLLTGKFTHVLNPTTYYDVKLNYFSRQVEDGDDWFDNNWRQWSDSSAVSDYTNGAVTYRNAYRAGYDYLLNGFSFERYGTLSDGTYSKSDQSYLGGAIDFVSQIGKEHELKVGFEGRKYTMRAFSIATTVMGLVSDYGSEANILATAPGAWADYVGNRYGYDLTGNEIDSGFDKAKEPLFMAAYITDKIEYKDLIIHAGLRFDYFDSDDRTLINPENPDVDATTRLIKDEAWKDMEAFQQISPRLGVSFPVSEKTVFYMQYGKFIQMPELNEIFFDSYQLGRQIVSQGNYYINPIGFGLSPIRTTSYEIGFRQEISDRAAFDLVGFYKNVKGQVQVDRQTTLASSEVQAYERYVNQDFATTKGVELRLNLRRANRLAANLYYTLTSAEGTGSNNTSYHGAVYRVTQTPSIIYPLDYNNTHRGSLNLDYRFGKGDGGQILENFGANVLFTFSSGHPFTLVYYPPGGQVSPYDAGVDYMNDTRSREALEELNSSETPWTYNVDLRLDKSFELTDRVMATVYMRVNNLFNIKNVVNVFQATGNAYDDGFLSDETRSGAFINAYGGDAYRAMYTAINLENGQAYWDLTGQELYGTPRQILFGLKIAY